MDRLCRYKHRLESSGEFPSCSPESPVEILGGKAWVVPGDIVPDAEGKFAVKGFVTGPPETPFDGHTLELELVYPEDYPFKPPVVRYVAPIFHPNVGQGEISLYDMHLYPAHDWQPSLKTPDILKGVLLDLVWIRDEPLVEPPPMPRWASDHTFLNLDAGAMFVEDRSQLLQVIHQEIDNWSVSEAQD